MDDSSKYWYIPNTKTMAAINEVVDDIKKPHLKATSSYEELEKLLDE